MPNEELGSARVKVALDDVEFKRGMDDLSRRMKQAGADFKLASAGLDKVADASKISALRIKELTEKIDIEKQRIAELQRAYAGIVEAQGANSKAAADYALRITKAQTALKSMEAELNRLSDGWRNAAKWCEEHSKSLEKAGKTISGVGNAFTKGLTVPITAAIAGLAALTNKALETADALQKQSDVTGLTVERIQELTYAGAKLDVEIETIVGAQSKLIRAMDNAAKGTKDQQEAFEKLGISVTDSNGNLRDSNEIFEQVIGALGAMENATERDSLSLRIFGRSAMELNPLIKAGSEELANLTAEARKNGAVLSGQSVKALDDFGDELAAMKLQIQAAGSRLAVDMLPMLRELATTFQEKGIPAIKEFLEGVGGLLKGFMDLSPETQKFILTAGAIAVALGPVVSGVGKAVSGVGSLIGTFGKLSTSISKAGGLMSWLSGGPLLALAGALAAATAAFAVWVTADKDAEKAVKDLAAEIDNAAKSYRDNTEEINANAKAASDLVDELDALTKSGKDDNTTKQRMATIIRQLNTLYPDLNLAIDEHTGLLNKDTEAVRDSIAAKKTQLQMQADEQRYVELLKERSKLEQEGAELAKTQAQYRKEGFFAHFSEWESLNEAIKLNNQKWIENQNAIAAAEAALDAYAQKQQGTTDAMQQGTDARIALTEEEIAAYETYKSRLEALTQEHYDRMGGLHDYGIEQQEITAAEIKKNLDKQVEDYQEWQKQINQIAGRVSPEVLTEMKKLLGPEYTNVLKELNGMTDAELTEYVKTFEDKAVEAKNAATDELDALITNMEGKEKDVLEAGRAISNALEYGILGKEGEESLAAALRRGGADAGQGLANGIRSKIGEIERAAIAAAEAAKKSVIITIDARSPSRVTQKLGAFFSEGFIEGITSRIDGIRRAAAQISNAAIPSLSVPSYPSLRMPAPAMAGAGGGGQTINRNVYVTVQPANYTVRSDADIRAITRGIADEVSSKLRALGG